MRIQYLQLFTVVAVITGPVRSQYCDVYERRRSEAREQLPPARQGVPSVSQTPKGASPFTDASIMSKIMAKAGTKKESSICSVDSTYDTPSGYHLVFGGEDFGANNAPGYMGFVALDEYSPEKCAEACNSRAEDKDGGVCKYFNIWQGVVEKIDGSTKCEVTCALYYVPTDKSTATNMGQTQGDQNITVTASRGYRRHSVLPDGGFEAYHCAVSGEDFCFTNETDTWLGLTDEGGCLDATIFHYTGYAHTGHGVGLLGSAYGLDDLPGTLTPKDELHTTPGKKYQISFFVDNSYSGKEYEASAFVEVIWNDVVVLNVTGYTEWAFFKATVDAKGSDYLAFYGGFAPAYSFIDDIYVFQI